LTVSQKADIPSLSTQGLIQASTHHSLTFSDALLVESLTYGRTM